jgi:hypothetical protein
VYRLAACLVTDEQVPQGSIDDSQVQQSVIAVLAKRNSCNSRVILAESSKSRSSRGCDDTLHACRRSYSGQPMWLTRPETAALPHFIVDNAPGMTPAHRCLVCQQRGRHRPRAPAKNGTHLIRVGHVADVLPRQRLAGRLAAPDACMLVLRIRGKFNMPSSSPDLAHPR